MNVKVTFFFEGVQQAEKYASAAVGWTETFYGVSPDLGTLDAWLRSADVQNYFLLRLKCMNANYRIAWIRVSDEANPRSYKVMACDFNSGGAKEEKSTEGKPIGLQGQVTCALLVDLVRLPTADGEHTHHRKFMMRALPADIIRGNIINIQGPNWPAFLVFLFWLARFESGNPDAPAMPRGMNRNNTLGLRYQNPGSTVYTPATAVSNSPGDPRAIVIESALAGTPGVSDYTFKNFPKKVRSLNRNWRLLFVQPDPPRSVLGHTRVDLDAVTYTPPGPGVYRKVNYSYSLFSQFTIIGLRTRKTGRLFRQFRGRSSNR